MEDNLQEIKLDLIKELKEKQDNGILEPSNVKLLTKLINNAENIKEAEAIAGLGTIYKRTGFHFDHRLEYEGKDIKYLIKNNKLSFITNKNAKTHKLIIGDNYDALLNLLISYKGMIDIIYIDPPYGKDSMGEFAKTNYTNSISRDNLLSMLMPRLKIAKLLLAKYGVIYCSIDDKNQAYLKCLFDEIFGEQNFIGMITQNKGNAQNDAINMQKNADYILVYCKNKKYKVENGKEKEVPLLRESNTIEKEVFIDENNRYYYKGSAIVTGGQGGTLNARKNLGYTIYYNPKTLEKIACQDYDLSLALTSNDENEVYTDNEELLSKGFVKIRPPRKRDKLGCWTWNIDKFNENKDELLITKNLSVVKKVFVDKEDITMIDGKMYYIKDDFTKNTKCIWDYSSSQGTTQLSDILGSKDFDNPKNIFLLKKLIEIYKENENPIILDFFAGSGSTGQAVLELNKEDSHKRTFILCTSNEITLRNPHGIAYDVTSKRLKRIMTGKCYDNNNTFPWIKKNTPYGDNLEVLEIETIANNEQSVGKTPFDVIDETLYGLDKFETIEQKIQWVCQNFDNTQKYLETDKEWLKRVNKG